MNKRRIGRFIWIGIAAIVLAGSISPGIMGNYVYADDLNGDGIDDGPFVDPSVLTEPGPVIPTDPIPAPAEPDPAPAEPAPAPAEPDPAPAEPAPAPVTLPKRPTPNVDIDLVYRVVSCIPDNSCIIFGEGTNWKDCSGNYAIPEDTYNMMYNICMSGSIFPVFVYSKGDYVTYDDSDMQTIYLDIYDFPAPVHTKRDTPAASYNTVSQVLSGIPECSKYSLDGGNSWSDYVSGSVTVTGVSQVYEICVKACGRTDTEDDSDVQIIWIEKSDPPVGVSAIHATTVGGTGGLNNVCAAEEYCVSGTENWIGIGGSTVMGLAPGNYDVRVRAHDNYLASDKITVTINAYSPVKEATPNAGFDGEYLRITNISVGMAFSLDRNSWQNITDYNCTSATITRAQAETAIAHGGILVKKLGNGSTTLDSDIQTLVITEAKTPTGLKVVPAISGGTGSIGNLSNDMEMSQDKNTWYSLAGLSGNMVSGLKPGTYYVRRRASGTQICSDIVTVNLGTSQSSFKEAVPSSVFDAASMILSDVYGCKYSLDNGKTWTPVITAASVVLDVSKLSTGYGILVKRAGNGVTTADSDVWKIALTKQPVPSGIGAVSATNAMGGAITGLNNMLEFRAEKATSWTTPASSTVTGLPSGKYFVRTKGFKNALPSDMIVVTINVTSQPTPSSPTVIITPTPTPAPAETPAEAKPTPAPADNKPATEQTAEPTPEPTPTPAAEPTPAPASDDSSEKTQELVPFLISDPGICGWEAIAGNMSSGPMAIDMTCTSIIPAEVIETAQATNTELILDISSDAAWSIPPQSIKGVQSDIDLGIWENTSEIPRSVIEKFAVGGEVEKEFTINHEGNFGFTANLTLRLNSNSSGRMANLYYYNKSTGDMELVDSAVVNSYGEVTFTLEHASSYAVILGNAGEIGKTDVLTNGTGDKTAGNTNKSKDKDGTKWWMWVVLAAVIVTVIGISIAVHVRKEKIRELRRRRRAQKMMHDGVQHHPKN